MDSKGRIVLPAKLREKLGDLVYVAPGMDECIALFSESAWDEFQEKLKNLPYYYDEDVRDFTRIVGDGEDVAIDEKTGRILLPALLREYAKLTQDVVIKRLPKHFEIWDKGCWEERQRAKLGQLSKIAKNTGIMAKDAGI